MVARKVCWSPLVACVNSNESMKSYQHTTMIWELFILVSITFTCIMCPLRVAMMMRSCNGTDEAKSVTVIITMEIICDCIFIIDFVFNRMRVLSSIFWRNLFAFYHTKKSFLSIYENTFKMKPCAAVLSFLPLILMGNEKCSSMLISLGLLRVLRIVAIPRQFVEIGELISSKNNGGRLNIPHFRLALIIYTFLVIVSFSGCLYFYVSCPPNNNYCVKSWTSTTQEYRDGYHWATFDEQMTAKWRTHYVRSLYFSMQTMFSIGYGDNVTPISQTEIILACLMMYLGQFAFAGTIANMTSVLGNIDANKMRFREEADAISNFMARSDTPIQLQSRVKTFHDYLHVRQCGAIEEVVTNELPQQGLNELFKNRMSMLSKVSYFSVSHARFLRAASRELVVKVFNPDTVILHSGEIQRELFIITSGEVVFFKHYNKEQDDGSTVQGIQRIMKRQATGYCCGDHQLIIGNQPNNLEVKSHLFVETLSLDIEAYQRVQRMFSNLESTGEHLEGVRETCKNFEIQVKLEEDMTAGTTVNKLKKYFGDEDSVKKDFLVIHPTSKFHLLWDIVKLISLIYLCFYTPLHIFRQCNDREWENERCSLINDCKEWTDELMFDYVTDFFFILDIFFHARCFAFNDSETGELNDHPEQILANYKSSLRFRVDVASSIPFDFLGFAFDGHFSLLRIAHMVRIFHLPTYLQELKDHLDLHKVNISAGTVSKITNLIYVMLMFQFISIIWGITASLQYFEALYWVVTTFTTVGYGDIVSSDITETIVSIVIGIFGALFAATIVANVTTNMKTLDMGESSLSHQKMCVTRLLSTKKVNKSLLQKVGAYYTNIERVLDVHEDMFLKRLLPVNIQNDFKMLSNHKAVLCLPMFGQCSSQTLQDITMAFQKRFYTPREIISSGNVQQYLAGILVQSKGISEVCQTRPMKVLKTLNVNDSYGTDMAETAILQVCLKVRPIRNITLRALTESEMWFLDIVDLRKIFSNHPEDKVLFVECAKKEKKGKPTDQEVERIREESIMKGAIAVRFLSKLKKHSSSVFYRSDHDIDQANSQQQETVSWVAAHKGMLLASWQGFIIVCISWNIFITSFRSAFSGQAKLGWYLIADYLVDLVFAVDVLIRARVFLSHKEETSVFSEQYCEVKHPIVNLLSLLPLELGQLFFEVSTTTLGPLQVLSLFRINKLLRAIELGDLFFQVERIVSKHGFGLTQQTTHIKIAKLAYAAYFSSHMFGSIFFFIGLIQHNSGNCNNWVDEAGIFEDCGSALFDQWNAYIHSLYWAMATLTTVGYGDIHASKGSLVETVYCTLVMLFGTLAIYSKVLSIFADIVSKMDGTKSLFNNRQDRIKKYCERHHLPSHMSKRIERYFSTLWDRSCGCTGTEALRYLPKQIHAEVVKDIIGSQLSDLFFLKSASSEFVELFSVCLEYEHFIEKQFIFVVGEPAQYLYILDTGSVNLINEKSKVVAKFEGKSSSEKVNEKSSLFGVGDFFARLIYACSAQTAIDSELFSISFNRFSDIIKERGMESEYIEYLNLHERRLIQCSTSTIMLKDGKEAEELRDSKIPPVSSNSWRVSPKSLTSMRWKSLGFLIVLYCIVCPPFLIAFSDESTSFNPSSSSRQVISLMDMLVSIFSLLDFLFHLTIFTSEATEGDVRDMSDQMNEARKKYMYGSDVQVKKFRWTFICDVASIIPLALIPAMDNPMSAVTSWLRLFQIMRCVYAGSYFNAMKGMLRRIFRLKHEQSMSWKRLINWIPTVVICTHWTACAFFFISRSGTHDTWVFEVTGSCFRSMDDENSSTTTCSAPELYLYAFYWSMYTLTTTGYGQVQLVSNKERIFSMFIMILGGVMCDAGTTAILSDLFSKSDEVQAALKRREEISSKYMDHHSEFKESTKQKCASYFKELADQKGNNFDDNILSILSPAIRKDIALHFCLQPLAHHLMFEAYRNQLGLLQYFAGIMEPYLAIKNEALCGEGAEDHSDSLYLIIEGECVKVITSGDQEGSQHILSAGSIVCNYDEINDFINRELHMKMCDNVKTISTCFLYVLDLDNVAAAISFRDKLRTPFSNRIEDFNNCQLYSTKTDLNKKDVALSTAAKRFCAASEPSLSFESFVTTPSSSDHVAKADDIEPKKKPPFEDFKNYIENQYHAEVPNGSLSYHCQVFFRDKLRCANKPKVFPEPLP